MIYLYMKVSYIKIKRMYKISQCSLCDNFILGELLEKRYGFILKIEEGPVDFYYRFFNFITISILALVLSLYHEYEH